MSTVTTQGTAAARLPAELVASNLFLLKRLGGAAKERTLEAYAATGLHPYHHAVLVAVDEHPRDTQGAIADALGYDRGQLVGLLDELEERGLVERRRDANDRRRHLVTITPHGKQALRKLRAIARRVEDEFLGSLEPAEREALHGLLLKLAREHEPGCAMTVPPA